MTKKGRPPGSKNKTPHNAGGSKKKEPTKRMSIPLSKVEAVKELISRQPLAANEGFSYFRIKGGGFAFLGGNKEAFDRFVHEQEEFKKGKQLLADQADKNQ